MMKGVRFQNMLRFITRLARERWRDTPPLRQRLRVINCYKLSDFSLQADAEEETQLLAELRRARH